jgi:uncharacterized protein involved in exopolysaccharide biosynthesis
MLNTPQDTHSQDTVNLREMFSILGRRKITFLVVGILVFGYALKMAMTTPPSYISASKIVCKTSESGDGQLSQFAALAGINLNRPQSNNPSIYFEDLIWDDQFLEGILDRKWNYKGDSLYMDAILKATPDTARENWEYVFRKNQVDLLRKNQIVKLKKNKNGVFEITTQFKDPVIAYELNRHVIAWFNQYLLKTFRTQARENRVFIEARIKEVEADLASNENSMVDFRERNRDVASPKVMVHLARLNRNLTINQEIYLQLKKQYELARIEELKDKPLIEVIAEPIIAVEKSKPKRKQIVVAGMLLGLIMGLGAAFFHHWLLKLLVKT